VSNLIWNHNSDSRLSFIFRIQLFNDRPTSILFSSQYSYFNVSPIIIYARNLDPVQNLDQVKYWIQISSIINDECDTQ